ncbi:hypothetical protein RJ639_003894 [Escallonia herrerae]|uniref:carbonic anhydrase n=1 Tax=Escallonia herrerae TaxID=1293975 RepID=A0AA88W0S5_9ASTE|nr:hypothetical protein RJ639_003894 [Escallonia herrerae]
MEFYVNDMLVKSLRAEEHIADLQQCFSLLLEFRMPLNPTKCAFGVSSGKFLGFMVSERGIEANPEKIKAIQEMVAPRVKEIQILTGQIAALSRFLSKSAERYPPFFKALKNIKNFEWTTECQASFDALKEYLTSPPLLSKLVLGEDLFLYLAVAESAVNAVLVREQDGQQLLVYCVSKVLQGAEQRYPNVKKLAFALLTAARKLRPLGVWDFALTGDFAKIVELEVQKMKESEIAKLVKLEVEKQMKEKDILHTEVIGTNAIEDDNNETFDEIGGRLHYLTRFDVMFVGIFVHFGNQERDISIWLSIHVRDEKEQDAIIETRLEKRASRLSVPPSQGPTFVIDPVGRIERGFIHFKATEFDKYPDYYRELAQAQSPKFLVVACSDSRVCPSNILNFRPGEAFMTRNIANMVPKFDQVRHTESGAVIEYAVTALEESVNNSLISQNFRRSYGHDLRFLLIREGVRNVRPNSPFMLKISPIKIVCGVPTGPLDIGKSSTKLTTIGQHDQFPSEKRSRRNPDEGDLVEIHGEIAEAVIDGRRRSVPEATREETASSRLPRWLEKIWVNMDMTQLSKYTPRQALRGRRVCTSPQEGHIGVGQPPQEGHVGSALIEIAEAISPESKIDIAEAVTHGRDLAGISSYSLLLTWG